MNGVQPARLKSALLSLLILLGRRQRHGFAAGPRWWAMLAVVLAFGTAGLPGMVREGAAETSSILPSQPFSEEALAKARSSGKPVFVYMTADWCLTCKVNEGAAIEREEVRAAFDRADVVVLRGGQVVEAAPTEELFEAPRDDYTRSLIAAMPEVAF